MELKWTNAQQKVIDVRNRNVLVSAAAGSGKTAVLVARILELIMDDEHPCNIDEMVIVTFTKAAAAQMRQRIIKALEDQLDIKPGNVHLEKQIALIHQAQITTIHGFCKSIIDHHFYLLDLEPGFRIGEEAEIELIKKDVLDQILIQSYGEGSETFYSYVDRYAPGKNDIQIEEQIQKMYEYVMGNPFPADFMKKCVENYENDKLIISEFYFQETYSYVMNELKQVREMILHGLDICGEDERLDKYAMTLNNDLEGIDLLCKSTDYESLSNAVMAHSFSKLGAIRSFEGDNHKEYVKELRTQIKDFVKDLKESYFFASTELLKEQLVQTGGMVKELVKLTDLFSKAYKEEKKRRNIIDFNDLEHFALQILIDPVSQEPSKAALKLRDQYKYIMIDEYQDSNLVQEIIMNSIARSHQEPKNIFMVGDVKQSIYRFRLARPELFMDKYDRYTAEDEGGQAGQRINLHQNFRSRNEVISLTNLVFSKIMKRDLGGIEYDEDARLVVGASYPKDDQADFVSQLILVDQDVEVELANAAQKEGMVIAQTIYKILEEDYVTDDITKQLRRPRFSDIVILSRSLSNWAEPVKEVLEEYNIPVFSSLTTGYFSAIEIQTMLALLHLIDNFMQDIPLVTVMTSEMFQFTKEELAQIRAVAPQRFFHQSVLACLEEPELIVGTLGKKLELFFTQIQSYQMQATFLSIHELIQKILDDTLYLDCVTAMPKGHLRRMNLLMLIEKAKQFENTSYKGVFHFLRYMERLEKYEIDFGTASVSGESDNVVRLMSTHKSKGLEFPIVIVANLGKNFNLSDKRDTLILHPTLGVGLADIDSERRTKRDTISKNLMKDFLGDENTGEELRILYVALTRAKEKLFMIGGMKKLENFMEKMERKSSFSIMPSYIDRKDARSPLHWIYPIVYSDPAICKVQMIKPDLQKLLEGMNHYSEERERQILTQAPDDLQEIKEVFDELSERFLYEYPYKDELELKGKMSVSEIKHHFMEAQYEQQEMDSLRPSFLDREAVSSSVIPNFAGGTVEQNAGAFYGTALHRYLELLDYSILANLSTSNVEDGLDWLKEDIVQKCEVGLLSKPQRDSLIQSIRRIYDFGISELGLRMCAAHQKSKLVREQPFVMGVTPKEAGLCNESNAKILVQGIMDAYFEEDQGLILVDYKTDHVKNEEELTKRYQKQMELYKSALERGTNQTVKQVILYSFSLQKAVLIL